MSYDKAKKAYDRASQVFSDILKGTEGQRPEVMTQQLANGLLKLTEAVQEDHEDLRRLLKDIDSRLGS